MPATLKLASNSTVARWLVGELKRATSAEVGAACTLQLLASENFALAALPPFHTLSAAREPEAAKAIAAVATDEENESCLPDLLRTFSPAPGTARGAMN